MIFHIAVFLYSLAFYGVLVWLSREPIVPSWSWYLASITVLIFLSLSASRRLTGKWYPAFLPSVVSFSALLLLSLIDIVWEQRVFNIVVSSLYYGALLGIYRLRQAPEDRTARALLNTSALAALFFSYAAAYGLYLNYAVPLGLLIAVFFVATTIVAFQTLFWVGRDDWHQVFLVALALGMIVGEIIWVLHFWPFGYLMIGSVTLILFYVLWRAALEIMGGTFEPKRMAIEGTVLLVLLALLLLTAPWRLRV
jgi:hypothetical protein